MENQGLDALNLKSNEEMRQEQEKDLDVLNLKKREKKIKSGIDLAGTGVKPLRWLAAFLLIIGAIFFFVGIIQLLNSSSYRPHDFYGGIACVYVSISCFVVSPVLEVLATIGEAAKIYKDKNMN